ncbi:MAG: Histone deacetylase hda1 [Ramalina farinacea]|uniref:Histone deacetylase hda1 n=1 Tax=Ramalina farinacea TaxID=258253 RepID=A0AA43TRZ0_9LECA|nr:Histone deacetylase hda1 [Ramalina farinacea]
MVPIPVYKQSLAASFKSQVMATPNFETNVPLVVLFHDPPEIFSGSPINSSLKMETMWMHDGYKSYAKPLIEQGMAFIDINIPRALAPNAATDSNGDLETRTLRTSQLAEYLWDNYIELNTHPQIFFIGVGLAYQGILALINARDSFRDTVTGIISLIPGPTSPSPLPPPPLTPAPSSPSKTTRSTPSTWAAGTRTTRSSWWARGIRIGNPGRPNGRVNGMGMW